MHQGNIPDCFPSRHQIPKLTAMLYEQFKLRVWRRIKYIEKGQEDKIELESELWSNSE